MKSRDKIFRAISLALFAAAVISTNSCSSISADKEFQLVSFQSEGCITTKAPEGDYSVVERKAGTLHLQSKNGNLKITLSGLTDECSIKEGYYCNAVIDGSTISVYVTAKAKDSANCICEVGDIETELSGLENGSYSLSYNYQSLSMHISQEVPFDYSLFLNRKVDFVQKGYVINH